MTTRVSTTPLDVELLHVAYNITHTHMVGVDRSGEVVTWQREPCSGTWVAAVSLPSNGAALTCICWAAPDFGNVVCGGTADGSIFIWAQAPGGPWTCRADIKASSKAATAACFAPVQLGPLVAVTFADGYVRTFLASSPLDSESWDLHSELQVGRCAGGATSLSWREPQDPSLPPLLAVGTATGAVEIWMYSQQLLRWEHVLRLGNTPTPDSSDYPITALAWAPTLGRPVDLIAVASGRRVEVRSLRGAVDAMEVDTVAVLEHDHSVWKLGWNIFGTWLACSTEGGEICMWRPDLAGEWLLLNKIIGGGMGTDESVAATV